MEVAEQRNRATALAYQHMSNTLEEPDIAAFVNPVTPPELPRGATYVDRLERELAQCQMEKKRALHE